MDFLIKKWSEKPINRSKNNIRVPLNSVNKEIKKEEINDKEPIKRVDNLQHIKNYNEDLSELVYSIEKIYCTTRLGKNTVIGRGDFQSPLFFMGEAPGEEEDKQQMPFVGASGKLLEKMLGKIGVDINKIYISNMFFWQPENNRTPNNSEIQLTIPYVQKHIELQQPKLIVTLGAVATKSLLNNDELISSLRGTFQQLTFNNNTYYNLFVTFHPAYILRNHQYEKYEGDFKLIKQFLEEHQLYDMVKI